LPLFLFARRLFPKKIQPERKVLFYGYQIADHKSDNNDYPSDSHYFLHRESPAYTGQLEKPV